MAIYPFQEQVAQCVLQGHSVILQAPTGAGKTRAALLPYLTALFHKPADAFPRRCVYAVPMRVLANQFSNEYHAWVDAHNARRLPLENREVRVRVQTGERAEDRQFEGDLIFSTIDQVLSNFLAIPYALSNGRANLNAAAVFGSYLVFDEFHLFPAEEKGGGALGTTLEMLRWLKDMTPFVLMTATFSATMLDRLCELLDAVKITLSDAECAALPSQQKTRHYVLEDRLLTAAGVLAAHTGRSIAICNTVARAQQLYRDLCDHPARGGIEIELLHSRFRKADRAQKERWAREEFGPDPRLRQAAGAILVATQVVEVGLDISCEHLHTDLAPANSVLQRAGRCARYEGNTGTVHIYRLPDKAGQPDTAPYLGKRVAPLCQATWEAFATQTATGSALDYRAEMGIIDAVHSATDRQLLDQLAGSQGQLQRTMESVIAGPDRGAARSLARELIRDVDNVAVVPHPDPNQQSVPDPWVDEGFSLFRPSVLGRIKALQERAAALGLPWALRVPVAQEDKQERSNRAPTQYSWLPVDNVETLLGQPRVFIHPDLVAYDRAIGFRFVLDDSDTAGITINSPAGSAKPDPGAYGYVAETYGDHITLLHDVYRRDHRDEIAWVARRLEAQLGTPSGVVDQAVRLTLACHDVGKLTAAWQGWAHNWQAAIGEPRAAHILLAHTHYDPNSPQHRTLNKALGTKRPHHAVEGAFAAAHLIRGVVGGDIRLGRPVISAIARHHNADSVAAAAFRLDRAAGPTLTAVLDQLRIGEDWRAANGTWQLRDLSRPNTLAEGTGLIPYNARLEQLLYFLLVRVLHLCDGAAVELANQRRAS